MHFPSTAVRPPISTADTREALKNPVAGDEAFIHGKRTPPDEFVQATPTVSTAEQQEDHFSLQQYLTFLEAQRKQIEIYSKEN